MVAVHVFDPAMCCSTGICGPSVDPQLVRFAADLDWLARQGVAIARFNLAQQPAAFAAEPAVAQALADGGEAALPLVMIDGEIKHRGGYPSRDELAAWAGVAAAAVGDTGGAAVGKKASGCCGGKARARAAAAPTDACCGGEAPARAADAAADACCGGETSAKSGCC